MDLNHIDSRAFIMADLEEDIFHQAVLSATDSSIAKYINTWYWQWVESNDIPRPDYQLEQWARRIQLLWRHVPKDHWPYILNSLALPEVAEAVAKVIRDV